MTSRSQFLSPELRELLGDISKQRESVLLSVTKADLKKLVDRPDRVGIDKTAGRLSTAEKELLDCRRFELAGAIHSHVLWSATSRDDWQVSRVEGQVRESLQPQEECKHVLRDRGASDLGASLAGVDWGRQLSPTEATRIQAAAVRLVPTQNHRIVLGFAHLDAGHFEHAERIGVSAAREQGGATSYGFDLLAVLASERFDARAALGHYRCASLLAPTRPLPALGWLCQAIYCGDAAEADLAARAVCEAESDEAALETVAATRDAAKSDPRWDPSENAPGVANGLMANDDPRVAKVAHVFL